MNPTVFTFTFPDANRDEANKLAQQLVDTLRNSTDEIEKVETIRDSKETQDFGATVVLILGTAAATAVAKGIESWLRRVGTKMEIRKDGTVIVENVESKDAATIARVLSKG